MEFDESRYPMTYEEYEKRVVELLLEDYEGESLELMKAKIDEELSDRPSILEQEYGFECFRYDHPEIFGEDTKKRFEDNYLKQTPVSTLRKILH